jgi:hypothetical protein
MPESGASEFAAASPSRVQASPRSRRRPPIAGFVAIVQLILFFVHIALYETWLFFWGAPNSSLATIFPIAIAVLSVSFVAASLAAHQYFNPLVRAVYTFAAVWLGFVNFFLLAAVASWIIYGVPLLFGVQLDKRWVAAACFGLGVLGGIFGIVNAAWTRVVRISVRLPNLPESWRGRIAAVVSDLHLGHLRNAGFL